MLSRSSLYAVVAVTIAAVPTVSAADTLQAEAQAVADRWDAAYNGGDMAALGNLYTPEAIVVTKGAPQTGPGIPAFFSGLKAKGWDDHKVSVRSVVPMKDALVVAGRWEMRGPADGGAKKTFEGNWVNVLEKRDGAWRTVLHTWN